MALLQTNKELYDKLMQAMIEVENLKKEAFEESIRRMAAEKKALEATRKIEESQDRTEIHEELIEMKKDLGFSNSLLEKVTQELHEVSDEKLSLENQLEKTYLSEQEMEKKLLSAVDLLQKYRNDYCKFQVERDHVVQEAKELKKQLAQRPSVSPVSIFDFSFLDIHEATNSSDPALIIDEGEKGVTYKGVLHHINVTILSPNNISGPREFEKLVHVLSKLRHPNIVTLIGICSESRALVFEYLSRGSLEDQLMCKDDTPSLPWRTRIQIATQLCSVLTFLHSRCPNSIIHGNLKPENILLSDNFVCKLHNFDPEILAAENLSPAADVYSFGIILLRLLTGKLAFGLKKFVKDALDKNDLNVILDSSAGKLTYDQAKQLASMALRCCDKDPTNRPDLNTEVWRVLKSMEVSSQPLSKLPRYSEEQVPDQFVCPISQEIMEDPHIAADGFTYDAQCIKRWLKKGTSPMTNAKLENNVLIPNHSVRSAIKDWLERSRAA